MGRFLLVFLIVSPLISASGQDLNFKKSFLLTTTFSPTISTNTTSEETSDKIDDYKRKKERKKRVKKFIFENINNLMSDIASGEGETVNSLAEIVGVPSKLRRCYINILKVNFDSVFPHSGIEKKYVYNKISEYSKDYKKKCS